jgi:hypothetical protein
MALVTIRGAWPAPYPLFSSFVSFPADPPLRSGTVGSPAGGAGAGAGAGAGTGAGAGAGRGAVAAAGNIAGFSDPAASAALAEGEAARDERLALAAWNRLDAAVVSAAAYVPLVHDRSLQLFGPRVTNIMFTPPMADVNASAIGVVP